MNTGGWTAYKRIGGGQRTVGIPVRLSDDARRGGGRGSGDRRAGEGPKSGGATRLWCQVGKGPCLERIQYVPRGLAPVENSKKTDHLYPFRPKLTPQWPSARAHPVRTLVSIPLIARINCSSLEDQLILTEIRRF